MPSKADARTVAHVLNRIGFGPRPGDVERVQQQGLGAYIDAQLHPEKIADAAMSARLDEFTTLTMSSRDLADKYYQPALELRRDAQIKQQKAANKEAKSATDQPQTMSGDENKDPKPRAPSHCRPRSVRSSRRRPTSRTS